MYFECMNLRHIKITRNVIVDVGVVLWPGLASHVHHGGSLRNLNI